MWAIAVRLGRKHGTFEKVKKGEVCGKKDGKIKGGSKFIESVGAQPSGPQAARQSGHQNLSESPARGEAQDAELLNSGEGWEEDKLEQTEYPAKSWHF